MNIPRVIIGTTSLGNIYQVLPESQKLAIVDESVKLAVGRFFLIRQVNTVPDWH